MASSPNKNKHNILCKWSSAIFLCTCVFLYLWLVASFPISVWSQACGNPTVSHLRLTSLVMMMPLCKAFPSNNIYRAYILITWGHDCIFYTQKLRLTYFMYFFGHEEGGINYSWISHFRRGCSLIMGESREINHWTKGLVCMCECVCLFKHGYIREFMYLPA